MPERSEVPEGWEYTTIKDILTINYGKGLKESDRSGETYDVYGSNGVVGHHFEAITGGPTIVIGRKGSVGEVHYSSEPCWPIDTTYYIDSFSGMSTPFICYLLKSLRLAKLDTSTAIPGINRNDIYSQKISLPPLPEQHRIVAAIEALFARLDAANAHLERVPGILKQFRQAVLAAACDGRLTEDWRKDHKCDENKSRQRVKSSKTENGFIVNDGANQVQLSNSLPDCWTWIDIDSVFSRKIDYRGRTPPIEKSGIPHITTSNIRDGRIHWNTDKFVSANTYQNYMTRGIPEVGDIFFTMEGPLGEVAVLEENRLFSVAQRILILRPDYETLESKYLATSLICPAVKQALEMRSTGSGVKGIAYKRMKSVLLPLPPLPEQHEIVRRVDALFALADKIEAGVAAARAKTETMRQSILAQAFSGRLVPTEAELARQVGREYEPASALLERIRSEKKEKMGRKGVQSTLV